MMGNTAKLISVTFGALALMATSVFAVTEVTVHPGSDKCSASSSGCYQSGSYFYTCNTRMCGNWNVYK